MSLPPLAALRERAVRTTSHPAIYTLSRSRALTCSQSPALGPFTPMACDRIPDARVWRLALALVTEVSSLEERTAVPLKIGLQLYSVRNAFAESSTATLKRIADLGYRYLEAANHVAATDDGIGFGFAGP